MKTTIVLFIVLFSCNYSNTKNLDSLANYYPLDGANHWLYLEDTYYITWGDLKCSVVEKVQTKDTIINNQLYFMDYSLWLRFDINQQKILAFGSDKETTFMDFNLNTGEQFIQEQRPFVPGSNIATVISRKYPFLNDTLELKGFRESNLYMGVNEILYADKIGEVYFKETQGMIGHKSLNRYLVEAIVHINDSILIFDDKNAPQIVFTPTDSVINDTLVFRFQVKHKYSEVNLGQNPGNEQRHFIDSVLVIYHYEKDSVIQLDNKILCTLENADKDFYTGAIKLDTEMISNGYEICYKILAKDKGLFPEYAIEPETGYFRLKLTTGIEDYKNLAEFNLCQNYPNPFNPTTMIKYSVVNSGNVSLKVYDVLGNEVATLVNEEKQQGSYDVEFESAIGNQQLASGIYFYQLRAGEFVQTKKMLLLR